MSQGAPIQKADPPLPTPPQPQKVPIQVGQGSKGISSKAVALEGERLGAWQQRIAVVNTVHHTGVLGMGEGSRSNGACRGDGDCIDKMG